MNRKGNTAGIIVSILVLIMACVLCVRVSDIFDSVNSSTSSSDSDSSSPTKYEIYYGSECESGVSGGLNYVLQATAFEGEEVTFTLEWSGRDECSFLVGYYLIYGGNTTEVYPIGEDTFTGSFIMPASNVKLVAMVAYRTGGRDAY